MKPKESAESLQAVLWRMWCLRMRLRAIMSVKWLLNVMLVTVGGLIFILSSQ